MKKSTKIVSMVIAITLVMAIMTFVIYAATAGKVGINASVSWTAQAGVDLEFWGKVTGGSENKEIAKTYINPTTTNATAKIVDDLSCNFSDNTDDGVNNPNAIVFRYYVRNKSLTPLKIQVTKYPTQAEESGTSEADHTPKVELSSQVGEENTLVSAIGAGYELKAGDTFEYSVTLSLASGGTGTINADTGLAQNFDAGVTFNFTVGGNSNGTIITSVDGATPTSASSSTLVGQTLGEYLATRQTAEYSTGWFFDEGLTKVVSDDYLSQDLKNSSASSFYNKTASIEGLVFTLSGDGNSYLVSGESETSPSGEVVIPNMYDGKPVSGVKNGGSSTTPVFLKNTNITSVVLPNTFIEIGAYAFDNCSGLKSVTVPNTVTNLGTAALGSCSELVNINIPEGVTGIGGLAFYHCTKLSSVVIPNSVIRIESSAFSGCTYLNELKLGENLNAIGSDAFRDCGMKSLVIPDSVDWIGDTAFHHCTGLKSLTIGKNVTHIGYSAFGYTEIKTVVIPAKLTDIGQLAFPAGVTSITVLGGNTKYDSRDNCNAVIETANNTLRFGFATSVIPNTVTNIGGSSFYYRGLTKITIPNSVKDIGSYAFAGNGFTELVIPDSVEYISGCAFTNCKKLQTLKIGKSVKQIDKKAFDACSELISIEVSSKNTKFDSRNNCNAIIQTETNTLIQGCKTTIIPSSIETIGYAAFAGDSIIELDIPSGVKKIDSLAFNWCGYISKITIPNTVESIAEQAFANCGKLLKIFIPKSVQTIISSEALKSIFAGNDSTLQIYCEASSKPSGWGDYWNYYDSSNQLNVTWGYTRAQFDAL